ncbi:MAG: hypothetical protein ABEH43_05900 [Flavobacteriales bacterium]
MSKRSGGITTMSIEETYNDRADQYDLDDNKTRDLDHKATIETLKNLVNELHPFKQYAGSKAKYETKEGTRELETYVHHFSEYLSEADKAGFKLIKLNEWFDGPNENDIPRLISFVFGK